MKSHLPKPLMPVAGLPMLDYVFKAASNFSNEEKIELDYALIVGHQGEMIENIYQNSAWQPKFVWQRQQLGTGHALKELAEHLTLDHYAGIFICCGDTPMLSSAQFKKLLTAYQEPNVKAVVASFQLAVPYGYGRIVRRKETLSIVEEKEATAEQKEISEVNAGFYLTKPQFLIEGLKHLTPSQKTQEYYLTDVFCDRVGVVVALDKEAWRYNGVNDRLQLAQAQTRLYQARAEEFILNGVNIIAPQLTFIGPNVSLEAGVTIAPNVWLDGKTTVKAQAFIGQGAVIQDCVIGENSQIKPYSVCEQSVLDSEVSVGPMAHLRPGSHFESQVKVGNFVETKKTRLRTGAKVSHLSYVGDADIGERTNIGCGFITCNYDGVNKHNTTIGADCFIGSHTQMIAPITIGDRCFVASGSTINQDMLTGDFAISRGKQVTKNGLAERFLPPQKKTEK